ncbi:hypothetical protein AGLY_012506, partial [Aphis glycines]
GGDHSDNGFCVEFVRPVSSVEFVTGRCRCVILIVYPFVIDVQKNKNEGLNLFIKNKYQRAELENLKMSFEAVRRSIEGIDPFKKSIQGFDSSTLALALFKMRDDDVSKKYDIVLMIAAYIERGNTVSKMDKNSLPSFANIIKKLIAIYGLVDKPESNPMAITLFRVAESFPFITCSYCSLVAYEFSTTKLILNFCDFNKNLNL